ncbi:collagen alpha-1(III) chain isoform X2 [Diachasma alloeum]|uniref:collagen alpha-1(III) chain isoform X2 n=1 Tax=Diachasma alloeum TaxID=454923 RepID=UPI0007383094|nr:collagen alpha-1(III) chain isoform X2 [Diachasma alloeum]
MNKAIVLAVLITGIAAQYADLCTPWETPRDFRSLFNLPGYNQSPAPKKSIIIRRLCGPYSNKVSPPGTLCLRARSDLCRNDAQPQEIICCRPLSDPCANGASPQGTICIPTSNDPCGNGALPQGTICLTGSSDPYGNGGSPHGSICFTAPSDPCCNQAPQQQTICLPPGSDPCGNGGSPHGSICFTAPSDPSCNQAPQQQTICLTPGSDPCGNGALPQGTICLTGSSDPCGNGGSPHGSICFTAPSDPSCNQAPQQRTICLSAPSDPCCNQAPQQPTICLAPASSPRGNQAPQQPTICLTGQSNPCANEALPQGSIYLTAPSDSCGNQGPAQPTIGLTPASNPCANEALPQGQCVVIRQPEDNCNDVPIQKQHIIAGGPYYNRRPLNGRRFIFGKQNRPYYFGAPAQRRLNIAGGPSRPWFNEQPAPQEFLVGRRGPQPDYHVALPNPRIVVHGQQGSPSSGYEPICNESPAQRVYVVGQPSDSGCNEQPTPQECIVGPQGPQPHYQVALPNPRIVVHGQQGSPSSVCEPVCNESPAHRVYVVGQSSDAGCNEQPRECIVEPQGPQPHYHVSLPNPRIVVHGQQESPSSVCEPICNESPAQRVYVVGQPSDSGCNEQPRESIVGPQGPQPHYHVSLPNPRIVVHGQQESPSSVCEPICNESPAQRVYVVGQPSDSGCNEQPRESIVGPQGPQPHYHVSLPNPRIVVHGQQGSPSSGYEPICNDSPAQRVYVVGQPSDSGCNEQPTPQECIVGPQGPQPHYQVALPNPRIVVHGQQGSPSSVCEPVCNESPAHRVYVVGQSSDAGCNEQPRECIVEPQGPQPHYHVSLPNPRIVVHGQQGSPSSVCEPICNESPAQRVYVVGQPSDSGCNEQPRESIVGPQGPQPHYHVSLPNPRIVVHGQQGSPSSVCEPICNESPAQRVYVVGQPSDSGCNEQPRESIVGPQGPQPHYHVSLPNPRIVVHGQQGSPSSVCEPICNESPAQRVYVVGQPSDSGCNEQPRESIVGPQGPQPHYHVSLPNPRIVVHGQQGSPSSGYETICNESPAQRVYVVGQPSDSGCNGQPQECIMGPQGPQPHYHITQANPRVVVYGQQGSPSSEGEPICNESPAQRVYVVGQPSDSGCNEQPQECFIGPQGAQPHYHVALPNPRIVVHGQQGLPSSGCEPLCNESPVQRVYVVGQPSDGCNEQPSPKTVILDGQDNDCCNGQDSEEVCSEPIQICVRSPKSSNAGSPASRQGKRAQPFIRHYSPRLVNPLVRRCRQTGSQSSGSVPAEESPEEAKTFFYSVDNPCSCMDDEPACAAVSNTEE